ncbi:unnamed protein product [Parnassius apollo]|uniref:(apollo) hypothetical protein n=1 Tax=Parnassius apollo TaxID=110799 RepID=A0A8S3WK28_PARAO|nr:unnamed protein product [Parnassius apollo]
MARYKSFEVGLYNNAGSIRSKIDEFQVALLRDSADIMAINETWLQTGDDVSAPLVPRYSFRHIPGSCNMSRTRGEGVGFYIRLGVSARSCPHINKFTEVEQQWISVTINKTRILIGTAYRPQWVNVDNFLGSLTDTLTSQTNFDYFILLGDFNINILDTNDSKTLRPKQFLTYTNSSNCISEPTHFTRDSATLIELVITDARVTNTFVKHTPKLGGHAFVLVDFHFKKPKIAPIQQIIRPIKSINMLAFLSDLEAINWDTIIGFSCVNQMVSEFSKKKFGII